MFARVDEDSNSPSSIPYSSNALLTLHSIRLSISTNLKYLNISDTFLSPPTIIDFNPCLHNLLYLLHRELRKCEVVLWMEY